MGANNELELLITVVVGADDERSARAACRELVQAVGGRIVASGDCSDEEPGCFSVTISRASAETGQHVAGLSRAVRNFLRELGPDYARHRVACEPPTAWTVVDHPELVGALVRGGERMLVEAWAGGTLVFGRTEPVDPDEQGRPRPRLALVVDVVTDRRAGAEWQARALAGRLSRTTEVVGCSAEPPVVRVSLDLGPAVGEPKEIVLGAVAVLGGGGWSRVTDDGESASARWSAAPLPPSGIAAIEVTARSTVEVVRS